MNTSFLLSTNNAQATTSFFDIANYASYIAAFITIVIGVPQLIKLLKDKKTGKISFVSFWVFLLGLVCWVIYSAIMPGDMLSIAISNTLSLTVYSLTMFFLYKYSKSHFATEKQYKKTFIIATTVIILVLIGSWILSILGIIKITPRISSKIVQTMIGLIFPAFTCLAFMPQIILSFVKKDFSGVSIYMSILFMLNNILWIMFWTAQLLLAQQNNEPIVSFITALTWQSVSMVIFTTQMCFTLYYSHKQNKNKTIENH
ncbi:PQ-loop domain-containing transporter [Mycoplasma phocoenae]|uniref:PQ-loop repeat-containing protein n=1 Tax=Mycoplasma phocoenae TaxID=754517 RepID=A0A858U4D1_9MOLU|nr:PQ-loop domain-containing transporter [Mycoplasma phocoenae]QJG66891.1 PQ-loop repeat-containing protein [Mycoplasma phocoenae]